MSIESEIEAARDDLLDVAPVERHYLSAALTDVLTATGSIELCADVEAAALAYARAAADRAYLLGLELGGQKGKMTSANTSPAEAEKGTMPTNETTRSVSSTPGGKAADVTGHG
jgi:hypothetical protein